MKRGCWGRVVRYERVYVVWFYLYGMGRIGEFIEIGGRFVVLGGSGESW